MEQAVAAPNDNANAVLADKGSAPLATGVRLSELIKRPELDYDALHGLDPARPTLPADVREQVNIRVKYDGYIKRQLAQVEQNRRMEGKALPKDMDYLKLKGLRIEAAQKLTAMRPENVGQASRIARVSPADISVLLIYLRK